MAYLHNPHLQAVSVPVTINCLIGCDACCEAYAGQPSPDRDSIHHDQNYYDGGEGKITDHHLVGDHVGNDVMFSAVASGEGGEEEPGCQ